MCCVLLLSIVGWRKGYVRSDLWGRERWLKGYIGGCLGGGKGGFLWLPS